MRLSCPICRSSARARASLVWSTGLSACGLFQRAGQLLQPRRAGRQPPDLELLELAGEPSTPHGHAIVEERNRPGSRHGREAVRTTLFDLQLESRLEPCRIHQPRSRRAGSLSPARMPAGRARRHRPRRDRWAPPPEARLRDSERDGASIVGAVADAALDPARRQRLVGGVHVHVAEQAALRAFRTTRPSGSGSACSASNSSGVATSQRKLGRARHGLSRPPPRGGRGAAPPTARGHGRSRSGIQGGSAPDRRAPTEAASGGSIGEWAMASSSHCTERAASPRQA